MRFGLLGVTKSNLRETDMSVSAGQISIQRQRQLAFVKALGGAVGEDLDDAHAHMGRGMIGS